MRGGDTALAVETVRGPIGWSTPGTFGLVITFIGAVYEGAC